MVLKFRQDYPNVASISRSALGGNFQVFRRHCGPGVKICPAVKADGYGHGISIVAKVLAEAGADMFAVANLAEAQELSSIVPGREILVFGPIHGGFEGSQELAEALRAGYHLTLADMGGAKVLAEAGAVLKTTARVHIKVDTGMGRMGALMGEALELARFVKEQNALECKGLYTHFATADHADASFTHEQLASFKEFLARAAGIGLEGCLIHTANSAASLGMRESHFAMVRPGISVYGYWPSAAMAGLKVVEGLEPILRLESRIVLVKDLPTGHSCGYGQTFRAQRPTRIGIVPIGYADGYRRCFSNRGMMQIRGKFVPVVGRVSMDQTILDLTDLPEVRDGDVVKVISEKREDPNSVESLAKLADTIPQEITCLLGRRIARRAVESL